MRRTPHPPRPRGAHLTRRKPGPAALAAALLLLLVLASGVLRSPVLLLLPLALLPLALALDVRHGAATLVGTSLVLLVAEAIRESVDRWEVAAALAAPALLLWVARRLRRAPPPSIRERPHVPPPAPDDHWARTMMTELEQQVEHVRRWSRAEAVLLWQAHQQRLVPTAAAGRALPGWLPLEGDPLGWVAREGTPLWLEPTPYWSEPGRSVAAARVTGRDDVAWVITCEYPPGAPRPTHEEIAAYFGPLHIVFEGFGKRAAAEAVERRQGRLVTLLRRIPLEIEFGAFGGELIEGAMQLTGATGGTLGQWNGEEGEIVATAGEDGGPRAGLRFRPPSELALAIRAGDLLVREDGQWRPSDNPVASREEEWLGRPRALVLAPLQTTGGTVVGALALWSTRAPRFDSADLKLLDAVLPYAALHFDHAREFGRMRERAARDPLTGLRNRRGFETAFAEENERVKRYQHPLSLLMIDLDHFKSINDQYGHEAGDEVLRTVARIIGGSVRDVDVPARLGGEEFVVLLPETPIQAAKEAAERLRVAVERSPVYTAGREIPVRVSVGVSCWPDCVQSTDELPGSADAALYEAKRGGRNRVVAAGP